MKLALSIAWRFLTSAKRQTLIIILGISVGVSVQVFIGSLISGLQKSLVDSTIGSSSHVTLVNPDGFISDYQVNLNLINTEVSEATVVAPAFDIPLGILRKDTLTKEILVRGFDLDLSNDIYKFEDRLTDGNEMPLNDNEVILGIGIKEALNLQKGDTITYDLGGDLHTFTIVNFFDFEVEQVNQSWAVTTLNTAQVILNQPNQVTSIEMQIKEVFNARIVAENITQLFTTSSFETSNWMDQNEALLSGLNGQETSSLMIQVFVIISVVLGISSVLAITVLQKSKQIGILKAMGINDKDASLIFLSEGFILGIFGAIGGVLLGLGLLYSFQTFALNPDGTPVVPLFIEPNFILISAMIALVASTLAALTPAIKSSKLTVIEVIRNA